MSMVFQNFGLFSHRTVVDNVVFGLEVRGDHRGQRMVKAMEVLELVGLSGWEDNYPRELSGGMQHAWGSPARWRWIPRSWSSTSLLGSRPAHPARDAGRAARPSVHHEETMVFITHDFLEAIKMGDHIAVMKDGEIRQIGTPEEIVVAPADDYVRDSPKTFPATRC